MPQSFKPFSRRPVWDRQTPTKFEKIFSYCVVFIVVLLGLLVLLGAFGISPQSKGILGAVLIGYGLIRFLLMKTKVDKSKERERKRAGDQDKEADKTLRNL
jgi:small neutral amino acid transporter SnatA (MarC family)